MIGMLLACALLTACQGGGASSSGAGNSTTSSGNSPPATKVTAAPAPTATPVQCSALTPQAAPVAVPATPTAPSTSTATVSATLVLAATGTHSVGVYLRDPWTGTLLDRGYVPTGQDPVAVAAKATAAGQYVYVANKGDGTLSAFAWSAQQALLEPLPAGASSVSAGSEPVALAIEGSTLYAADAGSGAIAAFSIGSGGALAPLGQTPAPTLTGLVAGAGMLFGINGNGITVYSVAGNGALNAGQSVSLSGVVAAASGPGGNLYVLTSSGLTSYTASNGTLTPATALPFGPDFTPVALAVANGYATVAGEQGGETALLAVPATGGKVSCPTQMVTLAGTPSAVTAVPGAHAVYVAEQSRDDLAAFDGMATAPVLTTLVRTRQMPVALASVTAQITANPSFLYVDNQSSSTVAAYPLVSGGTFGTPVPASTGTETAEQGPSAIALAPGAQTVYVSDWASAGPGDVTAFTIGTGGILTNAGSVAAGESPMGVAVDPSNRYLYVANSCYVNATAATPDGSNCAQGSIQGYAVGSGGALSSLGVEAALGATFPMLLTMDPTGQYLFVSENAANVVGAFSVDANSGALGAIDTAPIGGQGKGPWTLLVGPSGRHLFVADNGPSGQVSVYRIDAANGTLTLSTTLPVGADPLGLAMGPKGRRLYVTTLNGGSAAPGTLTIFARATPEAPSTSFSAIGTLTPASLTNPYALAIAADGQTLYVVNSCYGTASNNGSVASFLIPSFAAGQSISAYTSESAVSTGACSVEAALTGDVG